MDLRNVTLVAVVVNSSIHGWKALLLTRLWRFVLTTFLSVPRLVSDFS